MYARLTRRKHVPTVLLRQESSLKQQILYVLLTSNKSNRKNSRYKERMFLKTICLYIIM